jgi:hypothetical protein
LISIKIHRRLAAAFLAVVCAAAPVRAQSHAGVRAGVSGDPDQFFFGGHVETRPLIEHLTFRPNVEVGLGDGLTLVAVNIEFAYWVPLDRRAWDLYVGGGPAAIITSIEAGNGRDGHVGGGFNILVGLQHRQGLFTELKVGLMESPELKLTVGYTFR